MSARPVRAPSPRRSPAACLLPQLRERAASRRRFRLRDRDGYAAAGSPGVFYTYFSAGALLFPEEERRRRRFAARSPRLAIFLALAMAAIWLRFR